MEMSKKLSASAKVFVPDCRKIEQEPKQEIVEMNREARIVDLKKERDTLVKKNEEMTMELENSKIRVKLVESWCKDEEVQNAEMKGSLRAMRIALEETKDELKKSKERIKDWRETCEHLERQMDDSVYEKNDMEDTICTQQEEIDRLKEQGNEEWLGRTLKFKYLFDKLKDVGLSQGEWIMDTLEDIDVPEVPTAIAEKYIPTMYTCNIEVADEDEWETYQELTSEASLHALLEDDPELKVKSATLIQKIFRGYRSRGIHYYKWPENDCYGETEEETMLKRIDEWGLFPYKNGFHEFQGYKRSITFENSGRATMVIQWIRKNSGMTSHIAKEGFAGPKIVVESGRAYSLTTMVGHCFYVMNQDTKEKQFIRIPFVCKEKTVFNLTVGISYDKQIYEEALLKRNLSEESINTHSPDDTSSESEDEDGADLRIAIQMSLEDENEF